MASLDHFRKFMKNWLHDGTKFPLLVFGPPATSKSATVRKVAEAEGFDLVVSTPATQTPEALQGLGFADRDSKEAFFITFDVMKKVTTASRPTLWFIDDLIQGSKVVLNAYMAFIWDRTLNGVTIPPCVKIMAASNEAADNCGAMAGSLPATVTDRSFVHVLRPDVNEHMAYLAREEYPVEILTFLRQHQELSYNFNPNVPTSPTYRGWEKVRNVLSFMGKEALPCDFTACIGDAAGLLFHSYLQVFERLADIQDLINNPEKAQDLSREEQWAVLGLLENLFFSKEEAFPQCWRVIEECGPEMVAFATASLLAREEAVAEKRRAEGKRGVYEPFSGRPEMAPVCQKILAAMRGQTPPPPPPKK